ncbi:MAG: 30S ribosome-binding factor RbfA [Actinomycetota bacterium]
MATRRTQRVGENIREVLGELIQRQVKDPRVGFVTITAVRVTPDLSKAHIYYTVMGDEREQRNTEAGLESARPFLRTETARRVRLKTTPELEFHLDDTQEKGHRVDEVIEVIHSPAPIQLPTLPAAVDALLGKAIDAIEGAASIGIACHVRPDGDAVGSLIALALALKDRGIQIQPTWDGETVQVPSQYDFLPGADLLVQTNDFRPPDVAIAVDCATIDRLGRLADRMKKAKVFINLDHHVSNTRFAGVNVVDDQAASSAEIVLQLLSRMGADITEDIATCLYTGLVTDTGRFGYASTKPRTHAAAAFLIQRGVDVARINQALYELYPFVYLKVLGRALEHASVETDPDFVLTYLLQADLKEFGLRMDDTDDLIDTVRVNREQDVTVLLKELEDGTFKGSFRSKGGKDVGSIATSLGGGGHTLAAGFEVGGPLEAAIETVRKALAGGS